MNTHTFTCYTHTHLHIHIHIHACMHTYIHTQCVQTLPLPSCSASAGVHAHTHVHTHAPPRPLPLLPPPQTQDLGAGCQLLGLHGCAADLANASYLLHANPHTLINLASALDAGGYTRESLNTLILYAQHWCSREGGDGGGGGGREGAGGGAISCSGPAMKGAYLLWRAVQRACLQVTKQHLPSTPHLSSHRTAAHELEGAGAAAWRLILFAAANADLSRCGDSAGGVDGARRGYRTSMDAASAAEARLPVPIVGTLQ
jgi:hypothetical protein